MERQSCLAQIGAAMQDRSGQIALAIPPTVIFSRQFAITVTFGGIHDYSQFTEAYTDDYIHQFKLGDDTYLTIMRKKIAEQLISNARYIWAAHHGAPPERIMMRCNSTTGATPIVTDSVPAEDQPRYFDVTAVEAADAFSPPTITSLGPVVPAHCGEQVAQRIKEEANKDGFEVSVKLIPDSAT